LPRSSKSAFEHGVALQGVLGENAFERIAALVQQAEQQVLGGDEFILQLLCLGGGGVQRVLKILRGIHLRRALHLGAATELGVQIGGERADAHAELLQELGTKPSSCSAKAKARCSPSSC
jgi:hypothetical protein